MLDAGSRYKGGAAGGRARKTKTKTKTKTKAKAKAKRDKNVVDRQAKAG